MPRYLLALTLALAVTLAKADQNTPGLLGRVEDGVYTAPTGTYRIPVPVDGLLGGTINDWDNLTIFRDNYNIYITITAFPMDATQRWELEVQGLKGYLAYYFENKVLPQFKDALPGFRQNQTGLFLPEVMGGALIAYALLPGGSMFASEIPTIAPRDPPVAKRGYLIFIKDGFDYMISIELAERAIEGSAYNLKPEEEDLILRQRLLEVAGKMQFLTPPKKSTP